MASLRVPRLQLRAAKAPERNRAAPALPMGDATSTPAPASDAPRVGRIPALDGIRACAILVVFLSHAHVADVVPGSFGVTVFFFLSGYLITTLLRQEIEHTATIDLRAFYARRALRILPPMYAALAMGLTFTAMGWLPGHLTAAGIASLAMHFSNYYQAATGWLPDGYDLFWSLAVEEHFYLTFPLAYLLLRRSVSSRALARVFGAALLAVLVWRIVLVEAGASDLRLYIGSDVRMDSLLWGCLMAVWLNPVMDAPVSLGRRTELVIIAVALALLFLSFHLRGDLLKYGVRYTLQGAALFPLFYLAIARSEWPMFQWLEWAPLRSLGVVSYTFYLTHRMLLTVAQHAAPHATNVARAAVAFLATVLLASLSYWLMERPLGKVRRGLHASQTRGTRPVAASGAS